MTFTGISKERLSGEGYFFRMKEGNFSFSDDSESSLVSIPGEEVIQRNEDAIRFSWLFLLLLFFAS